LGLEQGLARRRFFCCGYAFTTKPRVMAALTIFTANQKDYSHKNHQIPIGPQFYIHFVQIKSLLGAAKAVQSIS
jgi:hypothetical protein